MAMKYLDMTGKTEEEAISRALAQLGLDRDEVSVEILERAKSGFFGIGAQGAQQLEAQPVPAELLAYINAYLSHAPVAPAGVYPVQGAPPRQHSAGKNDQTALLCVGSVPRGVGRTFGLEGCVFRGNALNIDSGDRAPVLRRHRPDDDLIHTFILGGPKNCPHSLSTPG